MSCFEEIILELLKDIYNRPTWQYGSFLHNDRVVNYFMLFFQNFAAFEPTLMNTST